MTFTTGLEKLLEKIAAINIGRPTAIHPEALHPQFAARQALRQNAAPLPQTPMGTQLPGGEGVQSNPSPWMASQARSHAAGVDHAQMQARQAVDPIKHEANQAGAANFASNPGGIAPTAQRPGFFRRAAGPLALAGIGTAVAGGLGLSSGYDEDQKYKNLAYSRIGQNGY